MQFKKLRPAFHNTMDLGTQPSNLLSTPLIIAII